MFVFAITTMKIVVAKKIHLLVFLSGKQEFWLCQVSNGWKSIWVRQEDLEPAANSPQALAIRSSPDRPNQSSAFDQ
jgi:hypothetical protein